MHLTNAWAETSGGVATFYRALIAAATRRCQNMCLVVPAAADTVQQCNEYVRIYHVSAPTAKLNASYRTIYPNQFLWTGSKLRQILRAERPDLIEINDKYTLNYLGPLLRLGLMSEVDLRPVVVGLSCERMDNNFSTYLFDGKISRWFCSRYMRYVYFPFFDHHIAVSDGTADELRAASVGHPVQRGVWKLPMGVDCNGFSPALRSESARRELLQTVSADERACLLLYAGRLAPEKNLDLLLETLEHLCGETTDYRLLIAGDGMSRASFLEDARARLGRRVTWLGHISDREKLARIYANCDFFLHPNPREPFGIAPLEAMASGLPLIAPACGGVTSFANQQNAVLAEPAGAAFAAAVRELTHNAGKRSAVVKQALNTAQQHSWESITDRFLRLYESLYRIQRGDATLDSAGPLFASSPPSARQKYMMSAAATFAKSTFSAALRIVRVQKAPPLRFQNIAEQR